MSFTSSKPNEHRIFDVLLTDSSCNQYKVISHFIIPSLIGSPIAKSVLYQQVRSDSIRCYTEDNKGNRTFVVPVDDVIHEPYLKTIPNLLEEDNLLSLPGAVSARNAQFEVRLRDKKTVFEGGLLGVSGQFLATNGISKPKGLLDSQIEFAPRLGLLGIAGGKEK